MSQQWSTPSAFSYYCFYIEAKAQRMAQEHYVIINVVYS